jgi:hypothetical protein
VCVCRHAKLHLAYNKPFDMATTRIFAGLGLQWMATATPTATIQE